MAEAYDTMISRVQMDDGANLHVKIIGENSTRVKPLLVSLHGAPGVSTHREPEASFAFLASIFRVLVYDARGSGASDHQGPFNHERWVQDLENLRIWAGSESFVLAGASYGTYVALEYAIKYGRRLDGLILRGAWANGKAGPMNALANILVSPRIQVDAARQVRAWSGTLRDDQDFQDAVVEVMPFFAPPSPPTPSSKASTRGSVAAAATTPPVTTGTAVESTEFQGSIEFHSATHNYAFSENLPRFDVRPQLHMIKVPTLLVVGRHDYITPVSCSQEIAQGIPHARLEIFEYSGHSPPSDEPAKFQELVLDFLRTEVFSRSI